MADDRELLAERDGLMGQIANESDPKKREALAYRLHVVNRQLNPKPAKPKSKVVKS